MSSPAEIIAAFLIAQDTPVVVTDPVLNQAWPLFISAQPDQPDESVCVYDTTGTEDGKIFRTGKDVIHPGIQLRVRSINYTDGWAKAKALVDAMTITGRVSIDMGGGNDYTIQCIKMTTAIIALGFEPGTKRREIFTINYLLTINELYG